MGFSTWLGPIRTGTVKDTTGTTAGTVANCGVVELIQALAVSPATTAGTYTIGWVPAGSQILSIEVDTTTGFTFTGGTSPTATVVVGDGTTANKFVTTVTATSAGRNSAASNFNVANFVNIGTVDIPIVATLAFTGSPSAVTAGALNITVRYAQKNSDGSAAPSQS
jgi:hypothetical protein